MRVFWFLLGLERSTCPDVLCSSLVCAYVCPSHFSPTSKSEHVVGEQLGGLSLPERYIVSRCHQLVEGVTTGLEAYNMGDAGRNIYEFLWDEYADW